jgi:hypothetical protein
MNLAKIGYVRFAVLKTTKITESEAVQSGTERITFRVACYLLPVFYREYGSNGFLRNVRT